jgi:Mor family transcriptional regulator
VPDTIIDDPLSEAIRRAVRQPAVVESLCQTLERQLRQQLTYSLGGAEIYVPKRGGRQANHERNQRIAAGFNGANYAELGEREGLHPRQVRRIVAQAKLKK